MGVMDIVKYPNEILTKATKEFDFINPPTDPTQLAIDLLQAMNSYKGVGIAANQVGLPWRAFAIRGEPENFVCFNPKIVNYGGESVALEEGCLSFPGLIVKIKRPTQVRLRFQTPSGSTTTKTFDGLTARIIQHEVDHLDGILFYNRANKYHRDKALKGFKYGY